MTKKWHDIRSKNMTPDRIAKVNADVAAEVAKIDASREVVSRAIAQLSNGAHIRGCGACGDVVEGTPYTCGVTKQPVLTLHIPSDCPLPRVGRRASEAGKYKATVEITYTVSEDELANYGDQGVPHDDMINLQDKDALCMEIEGSDDPIRVISIEKVDGAS